MIVGYARVSTDGQTLDAQQSALTLAGAERIYAESCGSASGLPSAKAHEPEEIALTLAGPQREQER